MADEKSFVEALAVRLESALPGKTRVERKSRWLSKQQTVASIFVTFETTEYRLHFDERSGAQPEKAKVVRGISLKTEPLEFSNWLDELSRELNEYAAQHEGARDALERFLMS